MGDLGLLGEYLGLNHSVSVITTRDLERFLAYLRAECGRPCSPKALNRRVTTLRSFFRWPRAA